MSKHYSKIITCPTCGNYMVIRNGAFGEFYGCSNFPNCTTTVSLDDVNEKFNIATTTHDGERYGKCLRCNEEDTLSSMGYCPYCQAQWDKD